MLLPADEGGNGHHAGQPARHRPMRAYLRRMFDRGLNVAKNPGYQFRGKAC